MQKQDSLFIKKVLKDAGRSINQHAMIEANNRVAVGVSGGKDSLALIDILARRMEHIPVSYTIVPVFIRTAGVHDAMDSAQLEEFCINCCGSFREIRVECDMKTDKDPCFVCSWHRRKALFDFCKTEYISTLALGHTMDDRAETLLMNMFYQGNISSMPLHQYFFEGNLKIIRPLGEIPEADIIRYTKLIKLPVCKHDCPYFKNQSRKRIRKMLNTFEHDHPYIKNNIVSSISNIKEEYL